MWGGWCGCGHGESNSCTKLYSQTLSFHLCLSNQLLSVIAVWSAKQIGGCGRWVVVWGGWCWCGEVGVGVGRWVSVWGGGCGEVGMGVLRWV